MRTILCVATYLKGDAFIRECHRHGWTVLLLTAEKLAGAAWPRESIAGVHTTARDAPENDIRRTVAAIARGHRIDRVAALDDFDVETGAMRWKWTAPSGALSSVVLMYGCPIWNISKLMPTF